MSDTKHQYKYGEHNASRSFVLEILWNESYPAELPGNKIVRKIRISFLAIKKLPF